jgi:hypothetical protein
MPVQKWTKTFDFDRSIGITRGALETFIRKFVDIGGEFHRIAFDLPDGERQDLTEFAELAHISDETISRTIALKITGSSSTAEWFLYIARESSRPSWLNIETTDNADLYKYKAAMDHWVARFATKEALKQALFFSLAWSENDFKAKVIVPDGTPEPQLREWNSSQEPIAVDAHASTLPQIVAPNTSHTAPQPASSEKRFSLGSQTIAILTLIVIIGSALIYYWQGISGNREATASEKQAHIEGEAQFTLSKQTFDGTKQQSEEYKTRLSIPLDIILTNVGKQAASNVTFQCGPPDEHGPYIELGTIAVGQPKTLHLHLVLDRQDITHKNDVLCLDNRYHVAYDDADSRHFAHFDEFGNEHREDEPKK